MPVPSLKSIERSALPFWKLRVIGPPPTAGELHRRYLGTVLNYVSARLGPGPEAEDVTAEVFGAAFASLHKCPRQPAREEHDPARAWLLGIARRKVVDVHRRRKRRPEAALGPELPSAPGNDPEARMLSAEASHTLQAILDGLPELQREVLRLKYLEELSLVEIGRVLGKSPGAVGQLLYRARQSARRVGAEYFAIEADEEGAR